MTSEFQWDDLKEQGQKKSFQGPKGESPVAKLEEGSNFFRIASNKKFVAMFHYERNGGYQKCANPLGDEDADLCQLCREKDEEGKPKRPRPYYVFLAIERSSGKMRILRLPRQAAVALKKFAQSRQWGDITQYDVDIQKGSQGSNPLYVVVPCPKEELSVEEQELVANCKIDHEKWSQAAKPEWVKDFIDRRDKRGNGGNYNGGNSGGGQRTQAASRNDAPKFEKPTSKEVSNDFSDDASSGDVDAEFENF